VKVILDACVWGGAAAALRDAGHDVDVIAGASAQLSDEQILILASDANQIVITLDKDFGELAVVRRMPHHGIVRLVAIGAERQGRVTVEALAKYGTELSAGAIVTVEPGRVRVRPAD
jgi:predicted nuclease of predicted toxin-antitoxin system